jgi:nitrogen regulatory protein P-II 1
MLSFSVSFHKGGNMKKIEAIIRPEKFEAVKAALEDAGYTDLLVTEIQNHGKAASVSQIWRGGEYQMAPMMLKVEVVLPSQEKALQMAREVLITAASGRAGDGKVFMYDIAEALPVAGREKIAV